MSYSVEYRQDVLNFCERSGNSIRKGSRIFNLSPTTIMKWKRLKKEGNLSGGTFVRKQRKLDLDALKALLDKNPGLIQSEMATHFGVNRETIYNGLKKIGYKRKKKLFCTKSGTSKNVRYIWTK